MKIVFVDGYNVINSWPNLKTEKDHSLEGARNKLINILHNYSVFNDCKVIIVFDAYKVHRSLENKEQINKNITVVFTKDGETADGYIERKVHSLGRRVEIYVVTSDYLEQQTIFQRGAVRVSSLEFYSEVNTSESIIKNKTIGNKATNKNHLGDNVDKDVLARLEAMRRSN
ncbi:NYN domain-containing protein [Clostridium gasigenes]|uniref:NYN domain-containing protein n=1 Tax=Clostridium gasigenes TaxID=94869 RepID=UPI001C0D87A4|nr:NYN domain-containing protein [Clostridium gasigenes]